MNDEVFCGRVKLRAVSDMILDYYMIRESICDDYCNLMRYGAKVVKTTRSPGGGKVIELKQINNIFYREDDADEFIKLIMRNEVTPVTLMDVVEDYIIESLDKTSA